MERDPYISEEAVSDEDVEEAVAYHGPPQDPAGIESVVSEGLEDTDTAVVLHQPHPDKSVHLEVDGTDVEAIFEDEMRMVDAVEDDMSREAGGVVDMYDFTEELRKEPE